MYEEITQKILDLLAADRDFKVAVKEYYFGERAINDVRVKYPHVWAELSADDVQPFSGKENHNMDFFVTVIARGQDKEQALKFVLNKAENIQTILNANPTLGGLVTDSYFRGRIILDWVPTRDYITVGARLPLFARKTVRL
ncbi:MAG: hypothetical protein HWN68_02285 [Desulfobacterales bacterium]|nr:hypothetical protein [Desulfobacterales bacterium]